MEDRLAEFSRTRLGGREVPDDLQIMLAMQWERAADGDLVDPLEEMGVRLLTDDATHPLLDFGYLDAVDRADPRTMATVAATRAVGQYIGYVAAVDCGDVIGYWFHPDEPAGRPAPLVRYDSEGQFSVAGGANLAEVVIGDFADADDEEFARLADLFAKYGVTVGVHCWDDLVWPDVAVDPDELHSVLYHAECIRAGLPKP